MDETSGIALRKEARSPARQVEFLLEDYKLITESMLRNEDSGEKRAAFFMALAGAAGTALSFAFTSEHPFLTRDRFPRVSAGVAAVLLFLGVMTIRRMAERHVVTDRHIFALRDIRRVFVSPSLAAEMPNAYSVSTYGTRDPRRPKIISFSKGGWMECVAAVNATLAGVFVGGACTPRWEYWPLGLVVGTASAFVAWTLQISLATNHVHNKGMELQKDDEQRRQREEELEGAGRTRTT